MNRAARRHTIFESGNDYQVFEEILFKGTTRARVAILAYCLMPNHWHLVISPQVDGELSRFMHRVTLTHARRWQQSRGLEGTGAVYQGRFKAVPVKDDQHFLWVCRYVERNPLRAGLVDRAENWRWSSLGCGDVQSCATWPVPMRHDWVSWVNAPQTFEELGLQKFRALIRTNEPFGDETWQYSVKRRLGVSPARPRGRPPRSEPCVLIK